ncbi:MAG: MATE family efflux transporter [Gammaproteobacteria bacterium]|nr:MATE family efflux transporter [Gammaproteobacteria bacterium]
MLRRMTIPMVYGIFAMFLFQAVDTFYVSLLGTAELAAISFTFPVTYTLISFTLGIMISMSIIVGKAIGSGRMDTAARITTNALLFGFVIVALISAGGLSTVDVLFGWLGASAGTLELIHQYIDLWYWFAAFLVIPYLGNAAIRATGDTKWPSLLMVGSGLINVILDPLLIFGLGPFPAMGIRGAAVATVIAWIAGFMGSIWLLGHREKLLVFSMPDLGEFLADTREIIKLGLPISLANMFTPMVVAVLTAIIATHGEYAVAAFGAGGRIESMAMVVSFALTSALSPYMAQNFGAEKPERANEALVKALKFAVLYQIVMYGLLVLGADYLGHIFSDDPDVLAIISRYLWIMPLGAVAYAFVIVLNTAFNAGHKSYLTFIATLLRLVLFVVPLAWLGNHYFGMNGMFFGAVAGNFLTALVSWQLYRRNIYHP